MRCNAPRMRWLRQKRQVALIPPIKGLDLDLGVPDIPDVGDLPLPPRAVRTPRLFSASAMPRKLVAREAVELGNEHRTLRLARCGQRCGKLWPSIESIGAFAGLDLGEFREERDAFSLGKACDCRSLSLQAEP